MSERLYSIEEVQKIVQLALNSIDTPSASVPAPLVLLASNKNGLSAREVAKNIIARQSEAGAPIGALPDGQQSVSEKMEFIRAQEIINHFISNARIKVVIPPGTPIQASGIDATGTPVQVFGSTVGLAIGNAIIE